MINPCMLRNGQSVPLDQIPLLSIPDFLALVWDRNRGGARVSALFGEPVPGSSSGAVRLFAVLSHDLKGELYALSTEVTDRYPSLTADCPQAHWFERELAEQWGLIPEGHPWLKPIRFHHSYRAGKDAWNRKPTDPIPCSVTDYFKVEGDQIHEVAVGPVHAGVIEPGSFRFMCHGENVYHLEISLGYQHRGVENALRGGPHKRSMSLMETLAGDTSIGHGLAYCQVVEAMSGSKVPARAMTLRGIGLELERLANHTGDLGALALDVGYLPTSSYCGRLRGDFLNSTMLWCGNRFGRSAVRPGGTRFDLSAAQIETLKQRISLASRDLRGAVRLMLDSPSCQARFEDCGRVSLKDCEDMGLVGPAARACGADRDIRRDFPLGIFQFAQIPISMVPTGDLFGRTLIRWLECQRSLEFVLSSLDRLPPGPVHSPTTNLRGREFCVSLVEGWRGEICHVALTDENGKFTTYKVVDPSFHNWMGLAMALRNQQISDFPVNNKSFNLSYCGHDL